MQKVHCRRLCGWNKYQLWMHYDLGTVITVKRQTKPSCIQDKFTCYLKLCAVDSVRKIQYKMYLRCPVANTMYAGVAVFILFDSFYIDYICICVFESLKSLYLYLCIWIISFIVFVFVVHLLEEQPDTASLGVGVSWVCAGQTHLPFHTNGWSTLSKYNYKHKYKYKYKWQCK